MSAGPRFRIIRPLASGGMGELFLAKATGIQGFERLVVLKRLRPEVAHADAVRMFLNEVRVLAAIQHPNVVQIFDVGTAKDGSYFYTMEFLVGQDLRKLLLRSRRSGQRMPLSQAVYVASQMLSGLQHVHERRATDGQKLGIIHRDISPANVFVTYDGGVKLIDFGVAKTTTKTKETQTGVVKGKFRYMSPEQCRADALDQRSDLFSVGIVLWEAIAGRPLFSSESDMKTLFAIVETDAPLASSANPECPPDLDAIVRKALSRDRAARYQSAREMQDDLEAFARRQGWQQTNSRLRDYMAGLFAEEVQQIDAAASSGLDVADVVLAQLDRAADGDQSKTPSSARLAVNVPDGYQVPNETGTGSGPHVSASLPLPTGLQDADLSFAIDEATGMLSPQQIPKPATSARARWLLGGGVVLALVGAALGAYAMSRSSDTPTVAPVVAPSPEAPAPRAAAVVPEPAVAPAMATPEPAVAPAMATPEPALIDAGAPLVAAPVAAPPSHSGSRPTTRPRPAAKPANWDPDSPLPPD